jgi:hypothetical protein
MTKHDERGHWSKEYPPLLSRVLDVGSPGDSKMHFLYETQGESDPSVALGHRWGGSKVLDTRKITIKARKKSIEIDISCPRDSRTQSSLCGIVDINVCCYEHALIIINRSSSLTPCVSCKTT